MEVKYSPSVNIIRDSEKELYYIVTPNAERITHQMTNDFKKGFHSFNIIGSYGTGKSSYLWAFTQTIKGKADYFDVNFTQSKGKVKVLNLVGIYQSIISAFAEKLGIENTLAGNQEIFDAIFQQYEKVGEKDGLLVVVIDEFGKFLEYAAKHEPERELYFIQQLAEFVNDKNRNILFITSLHQSFETYANTLTEIQRKEWVKVKGRIKELTFNEPVEQLLLLASQHFSKKFKSKQVIDKSNVITRLNKQSNVFVVNDGFAETIGKEIYPLELFSAYALTVALQQYGQNERSLFTFLESSDHFGINHWKEDASPYYNLANVYDYLYYNYYSFLHTKFNPHYTQWVGINSAIERTEIVIDEDLDDVLRIVKAIGLLNLFSLKGAKIDKNFLRQYGKRCLGVEKVEMILSELEKRKIIRFNKFSQSYKLIEGTDLDIDAALLHAGSKVDEITDVVGALNACFNLPYLTGKSVSYLKGTPRNFEFIISEEPIRKTPKDAIDGYINLIFNERLEEAALKEFSANNREAILYGYFQNAGKIKELLFEIEKTEKVLVENQEDPVAKKELKIILEGQKNLLNHYVLDDLYSDKINWVFGGKKREAGSKKQFNRLLSEVCETVYYEAPVYRNELVNKHKVSGNIHLARKMYFEALVNNWDKPDLVFEKSKFPPEKTIYLTLLKQNGIHRKINGCYELGLPGKNSSFKAVWKVCEGFFVGAVQERRKITDLIDTLGKRPFKMKQGLIDFWVPTFLFIKRGDYALYEEGKFVPYINETILYLITRNPQKYEIKTFQITDVRLKLFNKYREFLKQEKKVKLTNDSFIESIRPFLVFYKTLPDYCKKTQRLSNDALALRNAIVNAEDPEKIFFEEFPAAFKSTVEQLANSDEALSAFAVILNNAVKEIKNAYVELVNRIEDLLQDDVIGEKMKFSEYKSKLKKRFATIREHQLLPYQKVFLQRMSSPLDDRDSWIASIAQAILQKPLDQINDQEEYVLKDKLLHLVNELDNLREIQQGQKNDNEVLKIDLTTIDNGLRSRVIEIPKGKIKEVEKLANEIKKQLKLKENISIAVLTKLLNEELNNE